MPPKQKQHSIGEVTRLLSSGLRNAAVRPSVYGYRPHEKQVEFHSLPQPRRLFLGGNRSGKTVGGATEAVWWATGKHPYRKTPPPPIRGRIVSVDFLNGVEKIVRPEVARWMPASELKGGSWATAYSRELRTLTLENGSTIEFMSYDQDLEKFAGTSRHFVWFDEEPPHDIYVENLLRLLDVGGHMWITMTPVEGMTWIYDDMYIAARTDPNVAVVEVDMTQNSYLNQGEIESFMSGLTEDERQARMHGKFVQRGGLIYKNFGTENIIPANTEIPKDWLWIAGMDHGFNNPTAWLWCAVGPDGQVIIHNEHYESGKLVNYHAERVHTINAEHQRIPDYYVGDPSIRNTDPITGTSVHLEYIENGIPIILGNNDVRAGLNRVASYIEGLNQKPKLFITRNCVNLLAEIQRYRWATYAMKRHNFEKNKKEEPHKQNDHACDALRYIIASRPEMDDGKEFRVPVNSMGASVAVDPYSEQVDRTSGFGPRVQTDWTLGSEY